MINAPCSRPSRRIKCTLAIFFACLGFLRAETDWHLLIEPSFMNYEAAWPIPGAKDTVLVPARMIDGEILPLKREEVESLGVTRKSVQEKAPALASAVLAELKPTYVRDANKVIQYAVLQSENPLTASAVLAPEFVDLFAETLGPDLLIAIPNRNSIYVFPRQSPAAQQLGELIILEYKTSSTPVSCEIFTIQNGTFGAVATYRP